MILLLLLVLLLAGAALVLAVRAAVLPRIRASESVARIGAYGVVAGSEEAIAAAPSGPALGSLAQALGSALSRFGDAGRLEEVRRLLLGAGVYNVGPVAFLGYRVLATTVMSGLGLWLALGASRSTALTLILVVYGPAAGWFGPMVLLKGRAGRRLARIEVALPELMDVVVVTLEAGVALGSSLKLAADRLEGPLGDEIRLVLREQALGLSLSSALANMLDRCEAPAVRSFVRAAGQGESLGVPISQIMRELSGELRLRRRQLIEERAHKMTIKILFPLAFLIFPAIFIVTLYPAFYNLIHTLGG